MSPITLEELHPDLEFAYQRCSTRPQLRGLAHVLPKGKDTALCARGLWKDTLYWERLQGQTPQQQCGSCAVCAEGWSP